MTEQLDNLKPMIADHSHHRDTFKEDIIEGLSRPFGRKAIPPMYLYDTAGSHLFERICDLEEYYVTRTEKKLLEQRAEQIATTLGPDLTIVEPGAGAAEKVEMLLAALEAPAAFVHNDISCDAVERATKRLAERFPEVDIHPVCGEFSWALDQLGELPEDGRTIYFPGSTIGNMPEAMRNELLSTFGEFVGKGGHLLIGFDLVKSAKILEAAYDDSEGVTAEFNYNLIDRIDRELGTDLGRENFDYVAEWVRSRSQVEMFLIARERRETEIDGKPIVIEAGERIHTESSHKFTPETIAAEAENAGLYLHEHWTDNRGWFALALLESKALS